MIKILLFSSYCLLIFSEVRTISYHLAGNRSTSIAELFFLVIGISCVVFILIKKKGRVSRQHVRIGMYLLYAFSGLSLIALFMGGGYYLLKPLFFGPLVAFFFLSYWLFSYVNEEKLYAYVYCYSIIMLILFIAQYIILMYVFNNDSYYFAIFKYLAYGEGRPSLHKPFSSPSQAGLYISIILFLMVGCTISKGTRWPLYLLVPPAFLTLAQTGSRSVMLLVSVCWVAFVFFIFINRRYSTKQINTNVIHLMMCSLLVLAVFNLDLFNSMARERSLSIFNLSALAIITGTGGADDSYRAKAWKETIQDAIYTSSYRTKRSRGSTHNIYLDFLKYLGPIPFLFFVGFAFWVFWKGVRLLFRTRRDPYYPFYLSLLISTVLVMGEFYANPVLHLRYIWVFFGLTTAMLLKWKFKR